MLRGSAALFSLLSLEHNISGCALETDSLRFLCFSRRAKWQRRLQGDSLAAFSTSQLQTHELPCNKQQHRGFKLLLQGLFLSAYFLQH